MSCSRTFFYDNFFLRLDRQRRCFNFLFERFKMYYMPNIFNDFNWTTSLYRPALELPEVRRFRPGKIARFTIVKFLSDLSFLSVSSNAPRFVGKLQGTPINSVI